MLASEFNYSDSHLIFITFPSDLNLDDIYILMKVIQVIYGDLARK